MPNTPSLDATDDNHDISSDTIYCDSVECSYGYVLIDDAADTECKKGKCQESQCCDMVCSTFDCPAGSTPKADSDKTKCSKSVCTSKKCCDNLCESCF